MDGYILLVVTSFYEYNSYCMSLSTMEKMNLITRFITRSLSSSTSHIEPKNLPPTAAAAKFHSYRIFLQICQWKDLACDLEPSLWGWAQTVGGLFPITTDLPPAPEDLLKIIRCNCTTDCSSGSCSCQKYGMKCSLACG